MSDFRGVGTYGTKRVDEMREVLQAFGGPSWKTLKRDEVSSLNKVSIPFPEGSLRLSLEM